MHHNYSSSNNFITRSMQGMRWASAANEHCALRTAHAEEKKKGGHTNPDVRTIIIIIMKNRRCTIHVGLASLAQLCWTLNVFMLFEQKRKHGRHLIQSIYINDYYYSEVCKKAPTKQTNKLVRPECRCHLWKGGHSA